MNSRKSGAPATSTTPTHILTPLEKAKLVNDDPKIYGSFAEIGAGQEVARWFFRAGRASATIAKTMSAYDMVFSDAIYGAEKNHRYVCESRLLKMLDKEYSHIKNRIWDVRGKQSQFFVFADTVASKSARNNQQHGHGWLGVRFQTEPLGAPNDVIIHVRLLSGTSLDQQEAVGIIGVNLVYGCFQLHKDPVRLLEGLVEGLRKHEIEIDTIRFEGPAFGDVDDRVMSLHLVRLGLTDAVLLSPGGEILQPSEALFKKNIVVQRGRFRPATNLHLDMLEAGKKQFLADKSVAASEVVALMEITLANLMVNGAVDVADYLARVEILQALGHYVLLSNYPEYHQFSEFLTRHGNGKVGIIMGVGHLDRLFNKEFYKDVHGGMLAALGVLFRDNIKALVYPAYSLSTTAPAPDDLSACGLINARTYTPPKDVANLYRHMLENHAIEDIKVFRPESLRINSERVLADIRAGRAGWEKSVPDKAAKMIRANGLFGARKKAG